MKFDLRGKRLLFVGAILPYCDAIEYCKEMGIYTIVTDYLPDSPAKRAADKAYMVSTTDVDGLIDICKKEQVDGVFVGFMDDMLEPVRTVCERMGFPFYASKDQIRLSHDKSFFKEKCNEYGVPIPVDYTGEITEKGIDGAQIVFPVIVKPVDMGGGRGIRICKTISELKDAYQYALELSPSGTVLVEEYVVGDELTATYTMKNGEVSLSTLRDKLLSHDHENIQSQGDVLVNPSKHLKKYIETTDKSVKALLKGMKATDGTVFFQGVANDEKITLFELGYRPNSACDYRHISKMNGINYIKMMIIHALTGEMGGYELSMDNPFFPQFSVTFNLWANSGVVGKLEGLDKVLEISNVEHAEFRREVGYEITDEKPYWQGIFRAIIVDTDMERIKASIEEIQGLIKVENIEGQNMLFKPFDVQRLDGRVL